MLQDAAARAHGVAASAKAGRRARASLLHHDCIFDRAANDSFKNDFKRSHAVALFADTSHVGSAELLDYFNVRKNGGTTSSNHNIEIQHQNIITIDLQLVTINRSNIIPKFYQVRILKM